MASRQEDKDSRDFFPTPPWATRALIEKVLPRLGVRVMNTVWEPACGEGHMSDVLSDYTTNGRERTRILRVVATDAFEYGYNQKFDFLKGPIALSERPAWIITNPPFKQKSIPFVLRSLDLARVGVGMFVRSQWINEGLERYRKIFKPKPPTLIAFFTERVNLCKGRWDPDGSTATAYCWVVWLHGARRRPPYWIPPGCRKKYTHPDDRERFAK